jgi:site-specific DNA recombinase
VRQIFAWMGLERVSLREVCRRLAQAGHRTRTGLPRWDPTTVWGMLRNPAYIGQATFGRSRFVSAQPRLRPIRVGPGHPATPTHASRWLGTSGSWCPCRS